MSRPIEVWRFKFEVLGYGHNRMAARSDMRKTFENANEPEEGFILWENLDHCMCGVCLEVYSTRENAVNCCATPTEGDPKS